MRTRTIVAVIACTMLTVVVIAAAPADTKREQEWNRIIAAEGAQHYSDAATLLSAYIRSYTQPAIPLHLVLHYRLAVYRELAGERAAAAALYCSCLTHPLILDAAAQFDGRPVADLARERVAYLKRPCDAPRILFTSISTRSGKGGISVAAITHPAPFTGPELLTFTERLQPVEHIKEAEEIARSIAQREHLRIGLAVKGGLVVVVNESSDFVAKQYADNLVSIVTELRSGFFKLGPQTRVLYVFANFGDTEDEAMRLSRAVHFRAMEGLEGYFQSLDNSVVLRKRSGPYSLGTPAHELTHAVLHEDFPNAPVWLDEGAASLNEEQDATGPIDNYRLLYLTEALQQSVMPTLTELLDSNHEGWYDDRAPVFAAYARYFAFYLSQRPGGSGTLQEVYRRLKAAEGDLRQTAVSEQIVTSATGKTLDELTHDVQRFVAARNLQATEMKWGDMRHAIAVRVKEGFAQR